MNRTRIVPMFFAVAILAMAGCGGGGKSGDQDADASDTSLDDTGDDVSGDTATDADAPADTGPDTPLTCTTDEDCDDGLYCNGVETCSEAETCEAGTAVDCDDSDPCTLDLCDEDGADCVHDALDADGDGFVAVEAPDGTGCGGDDCDDARDDVYPGATLTCVSEDRDCSGHPDDDEDEDGHQSEDVCPGTGDDCDDSDPLVHPGVTIECQSYDADCDGIAEADHDGDGFDSLACSGTDCDDEDDSVNPDATETCDAVDQDCDGDVLDAPGADDDADTVLDQGCGGTDCNDLNAYVYPGAPEDACDGIDNDCDGDAIDGVADDDEDDYLDIACPGGTDCDDTSASVHPGATEVCDGIDQNCVGGLLDAPGADDDSDTVLDQSCGGTDCDDLDATIHPGATELCDLVDQDCDGSWMDAPGADDDSDGVLDISCGGTDCDDTVGAVHPGALEDACDSVDNDCDGDALDGIADDDDDDYMDVTCGGDDCDDTNPLAHPGAAEICKSGADEDCDGYADDPVAMISDLRVTTANYHSNAADVDWSGSQYGVVWIDDRDGPSYNEIYFQRVSSSGALVGTNLRVTNYSDWKSSPALAWTGSEWGIYYGDTRDGMYEVWFARVSGAGALAATPQSITADDDRMSSAVDCVWTGSEFGVTWQDFRDSPSYSGIWFARIGATGTIALAEMRLDTGALGATNPSVAWTGSQFGVAWEDYRSDGVNSDIYFRRVSLSGVPAGSEVNLGKVQKARMPTIAWTGSQFGIAYYDDNGASPYDVFMNRLSALGAPSGTRVDVTGLAGDALSPTIMWTGSGFFVVYRTVDSLYGSMFSGAGAKVGSDVPLVVSSSNILAPAAIWSGSQVGMAWSDDRDSAYREIYFSLADFCR